MIKAEECGRNKGIEQVLDTACRCDLRCEFYVQMQNQRCLQSDNNYNYSTYCIVLSITFSICIQ